MSKCCAVALVGVAVPERGDVALVLGSGLDSPRNSGGVGGWCEGRSM